MAYSVDTPLPPRVSISWLARRWDTGVSHACFARIAVAYVMSQSHKRLWPIVDRGSMRLSDLLHYPSTWAFSPPPGFDLVEWCHDQVVEHVLLDEVEVRGIADRLGVPLPGWFKQWTSPPSKPAPEPAPAPARGGRPSRRAEIRAVFAKLSAEQRRLPLKQLYPVLRLAIDPSSAPATPGLSDGALRDALRDLRGKGENVEN